MFTSVFLHFIGVEIFDLEETHPQSHCIRHVIVRVKKFQRMTKESYF